MKLNKKWLNVALTIIMVLTPTLSVNAKPNNSLIHDEVINTQKENLLDTYIDEAINSNFSTESIEKVKKFADISYKDYGDGKTQYTFVEKSSNNSLLKENSVYSSISINVPEQLKAVAVTTMSISNTEYNGTVQLKAELFFEKLNINGQDGYRIIKGQGNVLSNSEQYGRNLSISTRSMGSYSTSSGTRGAKTQGWYTTTIASPNAGTTYTNSSTFESKYYFCDEQVALLALNVSYNYSHNGSTWYAITSSVRYGNSDLLL